MNHLAGWIAPETMRTLGWALVHFLWQGLALTALAYAAMAVCRSAAARYAVGIATLSLMLAAPVVTFGVLWQSRADTFAVPHSSFASLPAIVQAALPGPGTRTTNSAADLAAFPPTDMLLWFVEAWFFGVLILSVRTAGGVLLIERMRRRDAKPVTASVRELCATVERRLGIDRAIRYCESRMLDAPAVIGWIRPAVLLPLSALTGLSDEQLQAIIAHELAHIRRYDNFVNLFQIVAETLLFYHPAVWWLSKRIRAERENCCDDAALSVCSDAAKYARALALMAESRTAPALAMAANRGPLAARVARLLGAANPRSRTRSAGIAASFVLLAGALFAANGFVGLAHTTLASTLPARLTTSWSRLSTPRSASPEMTQDRIVVRSDRESMNFEARSLTESMARSLVRSGVGNEMASAPRAASSAQDQNQSETQNTGAQTATGSYIEGMKAAGLENLTPDELVALKIQGVTPQYVRAMHDLGLKPSVDELIGMKVQGITPEYIRDMRAAGVNLETHQLMGMKVQGVTPEYVRAMHDLGIKVDSEELIGLKVQGVTPDYIKGMRAAGVDVNSDSVIGMKVQGVTPEYVQQMHDLGIPPKADELIALRVQGVTPEYIKDMRALGLDVTAERAIGMRVQGVTPEYVKGMRDLGMKGGADELIGMRVQGVTTEYVRDMRAVGLNLSADQLMGMRIQGVTPDYVKALRATGLPDFKDDPDCYIAARVQGITPEFIAEMQKHGFKDLNLDKLIELKHADVF